MVGKPRCRTGFPSSTRRSGVRSRMVALSRAPVPPPGPRSARGSSAPPASVTPAPPVLGHPMRRARHPVDRPDLARRQSARPGCPSARPSLPGRVRPPRCTGRTGWRAEQQQLELQRRRPAGTPAGLRSAAPARTAAVSPARGCPPRLSWRPARRSGSPAPVRTARCPAAPLRMQKRSRNASTSAPRRLVPILRGSSSVPRTS